MPKGSRPPSAKETAFECPHCDVYTTQYWFDMYAERIKEDRRVPAFADAESRAEIAADKDIPPDRKESLLAFCDQVIAGSIILERQGYNADYSVSNLHLTRCYNCNKVA